MAIEDFVQEMRERSIRQLCELAGLSACEEKTYRFPIGEARVALIRGGAIEKAAITQLSLRDVVVPGTSEKRQASVYQMEIFPDNPYCPMGHFNTEWSQALKVYYYMNLDLFPAVKLQEDLDAVQGAMDEVADRFGRDRAAVRNGLAVQYNMEHWTCPLASSTGFQMKELEESDLDLFMASYRTFFDAYMTILAKRKDTAFGVDERLVKHERNGKWLQYIALKDKAVKMALSTGIPPEVVFNLSFPPSAIF